MNQKIIITRKGGTFSIKGNGDAYLLELANGAFKRGEMKPTFWQKLRRFFYRLNKRVDAKCEEYSRIAFTPDVTAEEIGFIGLEERV
jgi:hypothetical protein